MGNGSYPHMTHIRRERALQVQALNVHQTGFEILVTSSSSTTKTPVPGFIVVRPNGMESIPLKLYKESLPRQA